MASDATIREANAAIPGSHGTEQRVAELAIGDLETGFGVSGSWVFDGKISYNWGGLTCNFYRKGTADPPCVSHGDVTATGKPTTYEFMAFDTMEEGFQAFYQVWGRQDVLEAARKGDAYGVAKAMYGHGYYTGAGGSSGDKILKYAQAIMGAGARVARATGLPMKLWLRVPESGSDLPVTSAAGLLARIKSIPLWKRVAAGLLAGLGLYLITREP